MATANEAGTAIQQAVSFSPDLIVASLMLPGLSGKDLLVALRSQGLDVPVLVTAEEGQEADAIQAFRLGAKDYMVKPLREAEALAAIERALKEVRLSHETRQLAAELADSHRQLEQRVRELTTIYGIGKVVTSTTNQRELFDKLMLSALNVTNADMGWVLLLDEDSGHLFLRAQRGMPRALANKIHQAWDDGVSSLVMLSAETLSIHGEGPAAIQAGSIRKGGADRSDQSTRRSHRSAHGCQRRGQTIHRAKPANVGSSRGLRIDFADQRAIVPGTYRPGR